MCGRGWSTLFYWKSLYAFCCLNLQDENKGLQNNSFAIVLTPTSRKFSFKMCFVKEKLITRHLYPLGPGFRPAGPMGREDALPETPPYERLAPVPGSSGSCRLLRRCFAAAASSCWVEIFFMENEYKNNRKTYR